MIIKKITLRIVQIGIILLLLPSVSSAVERMPVIDEKYVPVEPDDFTIPSIPDNYEFDINVVFIGFETLDHTLLESMIPQWYKPIERYPSYFAGEFITHYNYSINYNFTYMDDQFTKEYRDYIYSISNTGKAPWMIQDNYEYSEYVPSYMVEQYLETNLRSDGTPTLVFIDIYSFDPVAYKPYYYNDTYYDPDIDNVPRRYGSTYQIAGGGKDNRLLWMDLSAGPTYYREMDETVVPPIWSYNSITVYTDIIPDIAGYIQTSIELRFIPSYIYSPISATQEVHFQMMMVDLDTQSDMDYLARIDANLIISEYSRANPNIEWTFSISDWDWNSDSNFVNTLSSSYNTTSGGYDGWEIISYLDTIYENMFQTSNETHTVVPVFLFAFPNDKLFDQFLGIANYNTNGNFAYVIAALNNDFADIGQDLVYPDWANFNYIINPNEYGYTYGYVGSGNDIFETSLNINSGTMDFYLLDQYNYNLYLNGLPFNHVYAKQNIITNLKFNISISLYSQYFWIFENTGQFNLDVDIIINKYSNRAFGYTFVVLHELGHALGLSHPHDGYNWIDNVDYVNWLWDFSYSVMTYANHYSSMSVMDLDTLRRGSYQYYATQLQTLISQLKNDIDAMHKYIPENMLYSYSAAIYYLEMAINSYDENTNENNLMDTIDYIFYGFNEIDIANSNLASSNIDNYFEIQGYDLESNSVSYIFTFLYNEIKGDITSEIILEDLPWADYTLEIYVNNELVYTKDGYTWELIGKLNLSENNTTSENKLTYYTITGFILIPILQLYKKNRIHK